MSKLWGKAETSETVAHAQKRTDFEGANPSNGEKQGVCESRMFPARQALLRQPGKLDQFTQPNSTYGLDVLAYIGWQHEHEHKQLVEIQRKLNRCGILVSERNVGRLYRQFLGLLGAVKEPVQQILEVTAAEHGGLIWAMDALQPEGCGTHIVCVV